tara:strand:+ start:417 stop:2294 length:1878 start_codon:yes stop_codon:yes gene_type:complete
MAIYKIFPTKDTSLYSQFPSQNTGLDEILEASTVITNTTPQVSRYLLKFSQPEIDSFITTYISGSGITVLNTDIGESDLLFDQTMTSSANYPTQSDGVGFITPSWDLIPSSSTGNGRGQHFNVQTHGTYFIPNRDIADTLVITPTFTANDGTYGPFIISNDDVQNTVTTSSLSASINLVVKNNKVISAPIVNNGSASYVSQDYFSYFDNKDIYLTPAAIDSTVGVGVFTFPSAYPDDTFYFKIHADDLITTVTVLEAQPPYGIGYRPGDELIFKSESFSGYPFSDDIKIKLSSPAVSSSNWSNREFGVDLRNSAAVVNGLNIDQELKVYPISGSWAMGSGKLFDLPQSTDGASWKFSTFSGSIAAGGKEWQIVDPYNAYATASFILGKEGGGNWYTGSNLELPVIQSQSFSYGIGVDLSIDVTDTIKTWYTNSLVDNTVGFSNDGFLVKQSSSREFIDSQATTATFRYFSIDTNTIYPPLLDLKWNDQYYDTGSSKNTTIGTPEAFMSVYNNVGTYYSQSVERFRIAAIPKYPDVVFQTASLYTTNFYLPKGVSTYAIKDTDTNEFVIPFDETYTQISADSTSSFFDVYMNGLEPERYYTILIKTVLDGTTQVFDEDIMFKVVNG